LHPIEVATINDLDLDLFKNSYLPAAFAADVLAQNGRTAEEQLQATRLLSSDDHPSTVGILVVGKDPRRFLPGAYIQFLRLDGNELTDVIVSQQEVDGPLLQLLLRIDDVIEANVRVGMTVVGSATHSPQPEYPVDAIRQVVRNAVMHRNYEGTNAPVRVTWFADRIEILSPGGPFGQVTVENFGRPGIVDYRNPHVAEALKVLGFVERFGVGLQIARSELKKNGSPDLEIEATPAHVLVRIRKRPA
jgi:ATP-dependent DNA helicase RecG